MSKLVKTLVSEDGLRRVDIYVDERGFFSFEESHEVEEEVPDYGVERYWTPSYVSGLHETLDSAEKEAIAVLPWLRGNSN